MLLVLLVIEDCRETLVKEIQALLVQLVCKDLKDPQEREIEVFRVLLVLLDIQVLLEEVLLVLLE